jgi:hypothetical protein
MARRCVEIGAKKHIGSRKSGAAQTVEKAHRGRLWRREI